MWKSDLFSQSPQYFELNDIYLLVLMKPLDERVDDS